MKSILLCYWHGLGDQISAIPALKAFKEQNPDIRIGIATLKKIGYSQANEILGPYVDDVFPILSEPWEWPEKFGGTLDEGRVVAMEEAKQCAIDNGYEKVKEITTSPFLHFHKVRRVAMELNVYPLKDDRPRIVVPDEYVEFGKEFVKNAERPIWFFHWKARNVLKTLRWRTIKDLLATYSDNYKTIIECDNELANSSMVYKPRSILETAGLLMNVDKVLCIDSIVMHLSYSLDVPMITLFTMTPPEQVFGPCPDFTNLTIRRIKNE